MFRILETFPSIPGEGPYIGQPALFIRAAGCNLHCPPCDTPSSWNAESAIWMTEDELKKAIDAAPHGNVVLTGGEPLLQPELVNFAMFYAVTLTIETNGTQHPTFTENADWVQWSISPKLPWFCEDYPSLVPSSGFPGTVWYKFVVRNGLDMEDAMAMIPKYKYWGEVIFQPPHPSPFELKPYLNLLNHLSNYVLLAGAKWARPVRVLPQLHVLEGLK